MALPIVRDAGRREAKYADRDHFSLARAAD